MRFTLGNTNFRTKGLKKNKQLATLVFIPIGNQIKHIAIGISELPLKSVFCPF